MWGLLVGISAGIFSLVILLGIGEIYAAAIDKNTPQSSHLVATQPKIVPIVDATETKKDQQIARLTEELERTKEDLRQTRVEMKSLTDNMAEHFISNYRDTIAVVGTGIGIVAALLGGLIAWGYGLVKEGLTKKIKQETEKVHSGMVEESKGRLSYMIYRNLSHAFYLYYRALLGNTGHLGFKGGTDLAAWFAEGARETASKLEEGIEKENWLIGAELHLQYHFACKSLIPTSHIIKNEIVANTVKLYERLKLTSGEHLDLYSAETMAWVFIVCGTDAEKEKGKVLLQTVLMNSNIKASYIRELEENYKAVGIEFKPLEDGSFQCIEIATIQQGQALQSGQVC